MTTVTRYHDISAGHRVYGHEGACKHLHGHNYRIHFKVCGGLDEQGRVIDFSVIKSKLCMWLENNFDHKMILWEKDPLQLDFCHDPKLDLMDHLCIVPFNPTAEGIARYLVEEIGPVQLKGTSCVLIECTVEETRKCSATYTKQAWAACEEMADRQISLIYEASPYAPGGEKEAPPINYLDDLPF